MKHVYRVYEAYDDGRREDTCKTIELDTNYTTRDIVGAIFKLYGFDGLYQSSYYSISPVGYAELPITYGYGSSGKLTWVLIRGA